MTTIQLLATATVAALAAYLWVGVWAWRAAERRDLDGDTRLLIYGWLPVALIVAIGAWSMVSAIDEMGDAATDDDRAQMGPSPIWIPGLLTLLVIVAIVLNEVVGPLSDMQPVYAVDTPPQLALLALAVATVAATKVVGWYRHRESVDD